jgi:glycosyltransferase involved in cell wall biosynthesis
MEDPSAAPAARVSVIIPLYNSEKYLRQTLDSVLAQTLTDWELVLVDDGSTDATPRIAAEYAARDARIRAVTQANGGIARARNTGVRESNAAAPYVAFLDHDDVWEPDALETLVKALEARPNAVAAHGLAGYIDAAGRPVAHPEADVFQRERNGLAGDRLILWPASEPTTFDVLAYQSCLLTVGVAVMRRAALERAGEGPFDPDTVPVDDWDLWLRLSMQGPLLYLEETVVHWRKHDTNTSGDQDLMRSKQDFVRSRHYNSGRLTEEQRTKILLGFRHSQASVARMRFEWARGAVRRGKPVDALKEAARALKCLTRSRRGAPC